MNHKKVFPATCARVAAMQERHVSSNTQYICDHSHYFKNYQSHCFNDIKNESPGFTTEAVSETTATKTTISTGYFGRTDYQNDVTYRQNELYKRLVNADCNESQDDTVVHLTEKKSTCLTNQSLKQAGSKVRCAQKDVSSSFSSACSPKKLCESRQPKKPTFQHPPTYSNSLARHAGNAMFTLIVPKKKTVSRSTRDMSSRAYAHTSSSYRKISDPGVLKRGKASKKSD